MPKPRRGEIYWVDYEPARGSEQGGRRPALIVQNDRGNNSSPCTVVAAISSATIAKPYPFVVPVAAGEGGLSHGGHVNCSQLRTVDQSRLERRLGRLSADRMREVAAALKYELALD